MDNTYSPQQPDAHQCPPGGPTGTPELSLPGVPVFTNGTTPNKSPKLFLVPCAHEWLFLLYLDTWPSPINLSSLLSLSAIVPTPSALGLGQTLSHPPNLSMALSASGRSQSPSVEPPL